MIKNIPRSTFSKEQIRKASTCVVTGTPDHRYEIWNPEVDSHHVISHHQCDCIGFSRRGSCYHLLAVSLYEKLVRQ